MELIKCENINKFYKKNKLNIQILNNINLSISSGEFVMLLGPSGSGKTTLIDILATFKSFDSGKLTLFSNDILKLKKDDILNLRANKLGFVFQDFNLIESLNVYDNILLANVISKKENKKKIKSLLKDVGLAGYENYYINELSGGMKQRVAIARALINDQQIIFADEPTGNLDSLNSKKIMELFTKINKKYNTCIVMVTHDESLTKYASRVVKMLDGEIIYDKKKN